MKKLAFGVVTALAVFTAAPAMAQVGFFAGPGGIGIEFGGPGFYSERPWGYGYYNDWGPGFGWNHDFWRSNYYDYSGFGWGPASSWGPGFGWNGYSDYYYRGPRVGWHRRYHGVRLHNFYNRYTASPFRYHHWP